MPIAPSSIDCLTIFLIFCISLSVAGLFSKPTSIIRAVVAPRNEAMLVETPLFSKASIASLKEWRSPSFTYGPGEAPSPKTSRVTPCFKSLKDLPSSIKEEYAQLSIFIKPGETERAVASIIVSASNLVFFPTYIILSSVMPTEPTYGLFPDPS